MQVFGKSRFFILVLGAFLALSGCQNSEEQAEEHYQRALALMAEGDLDRARVEFLNVFDNNGFHEDARADFAAMLRDQGQAQQSYSQYLRLVEQYPDHVEGRIALAEMALQFQNPEEAERHGTRAQELAADDPRVAVITVSLDYAAAVEAEDAPARRAAFDRGQALMEADPENLLLLRLVVDNALREGDLDAALVAIDSSLDREPDNRILHDVRLGVLAELEQAEAVEDQLRVMLERFPEDEDLPGVLLRFFLARGEFDAAGDFLRDRAAAGTDPEARQGAQTSLVQLLLQTEGTEAALAELDGIIAVEAAATDATADGASGTAVYRALRASIRFDLGETDAGIAEMEEILTGDLDLLAEGRIRVGLAQMLLATGNVVGARAQVEQVLEADPRQSEAMKMRAAWLIEEDEADRAVALLRTVLDDNPDDPQALTLMAEAHVRNGNRQLAREFLSLAVEASNSAPAETLRYARLLMEDERFLPAEEILIDALRLAPNNLDLMAVLGELYIAMEDWPRAEQVEATLRNTDEEPFRRVADGLQAGRLAAQGRVEDAVAFLEGIAASGETTDVRAQIAVVRARLASDDAEGALSFAEELVAEAPDELGYRFTLAAVQSATGDLEAAEASFRALTEDQPEVQQSWIGLIRALNGQGRSEEAEAVLEEALTVLPEALDLLWAQASFRERAGNYDGAIEIYELMYDRAPNAAVVANNLASLLSTYRDDDDSLERAFAVARRLRGSDVPAFQDTFGWISYRRGEFDVALEHLEPAAEGLADDALVQYHLGMTYLALERPEEALAQLRRAVDIAGPDDPRTQFETARAEIARLEAEAEGTE